MTCPICGSTVPYQHNYEFCVLDGHEERDSDGTATAAVCEDIPVPEGLPSAAIAQTKSVNP
jgi:hypothetical protein